MNVEKALHDFGPRLGFDFSAVGQFKILKLHSTLPESHAEPFESVPLGCRRIILATSVAETSITIPDVKFVVDTGKVRQHIYYPETRSRELAYCWVSKSCVAQRSGRAGRVRDGEYFALFPKEKFESFRITKAPEIARSDIQELCLRGKKAFPQTPVQDVLRLAIEPPGDARVSAAVAELEHMAALDQDENLTPLGHHLLKLAVHPTLGKLILLGVIFRCLDPLVIIGALGDDLNLFRVPVENQGREVQCRLRSGYAEASKSDHITAINTFKTLREAFYKEGPRGAKDFADSQFIHFPRFNAALKVAEHIVDHLSNQNLIPLQNPDEGDIEFGGADLNVNSGRTSLIKGLLLHVLSLNLAAPAPMAGDRGYLTNANRVGFISSTSVNAEKPPRGLLVFDYKQPSSKDPFIFQNTTLVTPLAACLLGRPLEVLDHNLCMDSWLEMPIKVDAKNKGDYAVRLLLETRKALDMVRWLARIYD